jgi:hypothetical protein
MVMANMSDAESTVLIVLFAVAFGGWLIPVTIHILAANWRKARESAHLAALKQSMVEKGMPVEEIERVLRAPVDVASPVPVKEASSIVELAEKLAEHEIEANVIHDILVAFRGAEPSMQRTAVNSVEAMLDNGADSERVLAAVRALCGPAPAPEFGSKDYRFTDEASALRQ